ncbi:hypothetical protein AD946_04975 [Gluconobacter thailandicus]|nr:hypothetical protein AD940_10800 [Gluconobacter thailandicus]KXV54055.1 hypothetical protein AD946_04975 [Gluconobacter thailandicus]
MAVNCAESSVMIQKDDLTERLRTAIRPHLIRFQGNGLPSGQAIAAESAIHGAVLPRPKLECHR